IAFCDEQEIPYRTCGKLIIAVDETEVPKLKELQRRGTENGVPGLRWVDEADIREIEPHAVGAAALHTLDTAIVDFSLVAQAMARQIVRRGGRIVMSRPVGGIRGGASQVEVRTTSATYRASTLVTWAGLHSDRIARLHGPANDPGSDL